ncbi:hypothetical protein [Nonomuraea sp. NPDC003754]
MTLPRRTLLSGVGLGAFALVSGVASPAAQAGTSSRLHGLAAPDVNPTEYFRQLRQVLIDNDNLLGPLRVIPTVESQIGAIQQVRQVHHGKDAGDLTYLQAQYAEFCSWLHHDAGDFRSSQYWLDRALEWSYTTGDQDITTYILARKAQLAGDMSDAKTAIDLSAAAETRARRDTRLSAIAATYAAYGHALAGEARASAQAVDRARGLLSDLDLDPASPWGAWMNPAYIEVHQAWSLYALGHHAEAAQGFRTAIDALPAAYHRDRGVYLARESLAHAGAKEPEQAATVGLQAIGIAEATGSARIITELIRLDAKLEHWRQVRAVAEYRQELDGLVARQA